jgi:hypothetical protein
VSVDDRDDPIRVRRESAHHLPAREPDMLLTTAPGLFSASPIPLPLIGKNEQVEQREQHCHLSQSGDLIRVHDPPFRSSAIKMSAADKAHRQIIDVRVRSPMQVALPASSCAATATRSGITGCAASGAGGGGGGGGVPVFSVRSRSLAAARSRIVRS